jgi:hypothetical protein
MSEQKPALRETQYDNQIVRMFVVALNDEL